MPAVRRGRACCFHKWEKPGVSKVWANRPSVEDPGRNWLNGTMVEDLDAAKRTPIERPGLGGARYAARFRTSRYTQRGAC